MKVRLAFAVAAHLEPEILIVDEVLAVGDAEFQRKCMSKMQNVARGGRTVLFVSHSMAAIQSLCDSCLVLDHGTVSFHGPTKAAVDVYRKTNDHVTEAIQTPISGENVTLTRFTTTSNTTSPARVIDFGAPLTLSLSVNVAEHVPNLHLRLIIFRVSDDLRVSSFSTRETPIGPLPAGETHLDISTSSLLLFPGEYYWSLSVLTSHHVYLDIECAERFSVHPHILEGCPSAYEAAHGVFHFPLDIRVAHDSRPTTYQVLKGATIF
jgi:lipopolysaccharide transport system ATP-binding protein